MAASCRTLNKLVKFSATGACVPDGDVRLFVEQRKLGVYHSIRPPVSFLRWVRDYFRLLCDADIQHRAEETSNAQLSSTVTGFLGRPGYLEPIRNFVSYWYLGLRAVTGKRVNALRRLTG